MYVRTRNKATTLFVALAVVLAVMGMSYALWSKELFISGEVHTGTLDVVFRDVTCSDQGIDNPYIPEPKDVAECSVELTDEDEVMIVTITNAYPCYWCNITFSLVNVGTIPVKIQSIEIRNPNEAEVNVYLKGLELGDQIDPGEGLSGELDIHVKQGAEQGATYTFSIRIFVVQWNEYE